MKPQIIIIVTVLIIIAMYFIKAYIVKLKKELKKNTDKKIEENYKLDLFKNQIKENISNVFIDFKIHPLVEIVYDRFINMKDPSEFKIIYNTVYIDGINIWSANGVEHRKFQQLDIKWEKQFNKTTNEINKELNQIDKYILNEIVTKVIIDNKEFIHRVFINSPLK